MSNHFDANGQAHMVDVSEKSVTSRSATAAASVSMSPLASDSIRDRTAAKGDVLSVARLAGIMAAKQTPALIPLCHAIPIESVSVHFEWAEPNDSRSPCLQITSTVGTAGKTGVEMEALTAVSVAALTVYDMLKSVDRAIHIDGIRLLRKSGGKSGDYTA